MRMFSYALCQMARKLQNALAQASFKTRNGAETLGIDDQGGARKRRRSDTTISPISSSSSEPQLLGHPYNSSPIKPSGPAYSIYKAHVNPGSHQRNMNHPRFTYPSPRKRRSFQHTDITLPTVEISRASWKSKHKLPESSPASHPQYVHFPISHEASISFMPESPPIGHVSDEDLNISQNSYNQESYSFNAAGPRTPPPTRTRSNRHRKSNATGEEACFLDLVSSPSPANLGAHASGMYPPSTPPSNNTFIGASMISTPRGGGYAAPITPGPPLNFSEFLNMTPTPSPAQGAFGNYTPGLPNTPLAAREARKKFQDGGLAVGEVDPLLGNPALRSSKKGTGLGMDLGGELLPH